MFEHIFRLFYSHLNFLVPKKTPLGLHKQRLYSQLTDKMQENEIQSSILKTIMI